MDNGRGRSAPRPSVREVTDWAGAAYEAVELLGYGPASEAWRGRVRATGERVVLRRLTPPDPALAERARAVTRSPHVLRVRDVSDALLVVEHAPGGSLEALLTRRGALSPGEVVTALAPVAQALVTAHHGALRASSVLLDAVGRPLLELPGEGDGDDVQALGDLALRCLAGTAPDLPPTVPLPLAAAVTAARAGEVTMAELAEQLLAACPATPLDGLASAPPAPRRRRSGLPWVAAAALLVVVAAGWGWGRHSSTGTATELPSAAPSPDWSRVLGELDAARATAFASGNARLLEQVWAGAQRSADAALLARVGSALGAAHDIAAVRAVDVSGVRAVLQVRERVVGGAWADHRVVLVRTAAGWRVESVSG